MKKKQHRKKIEVCLVVLMGLFFLFRGEVGEAKDVTKIILNEENKKISMRDTWRLEKIQNGYPGMEILEPYAIEIENQTTRTFDLTLTIGKPKVALEDWSKIMSVHLIKGDQVLPVKGTKEAYTEERFHVPAQSKTQIGYVYELIGNRIDNRYQQQTLMIPWNIQVQETGEEGGGTILPLPLVPPKKPVTEGLNEWKSGWLPQLGGASTVLFVVIGLLLVGTLLWLRRMKVDLTKKRN